MLDSRLVDPGSTLIHVGIVGAYNPIRSSQEITYCVLRQSTEWDTSKLE